MLFQVFKELYLMMLSSLMMELLFCVDVESHLTQFAVDESLMHQSGGSSTNAQPILLNANCTTTSRVANCSPISQTLNISNFIVTSLSIQMGKEVEFFKLTSTK